MCSYMVSELCVLLWYQSHMLTPIFNHVPIFFFFLFTHQSFCIFHHNQNKNAHNYLSHANFFSWIFSSFHIFSFCARAISLLTPMSVSLYVKMTCRTAIVSSTSKYHPPNSLLLKKNLPKEVSCS